MTVIDIAVAMRHLKMDPDDDSTEVLSKLEDAEDIAMTYMGRRIYATPDLLAAGVLNGDAGDDPIVIKPGIRAAILLILGRLNSHREDVVVGVSATELPQGAETLLRPHRVDMGV